MPPAAPSIGGVERKRVSPAAASMRKAACPLISSGASSPVEPGGCMAQHTAVLTRSHGIILQLGDDNAPGGIRYECLSCQ